MKIERRSDKHLICHMWVMFLFEEMFKDVLGSIIATLITAAITGIVAWLIIKGNYKKLTFASKMKKFGFLQTVSVNEISEHEKRMIYFHSNEIKIIYVSGNSFFKKNEHYLREALARNVNIKILLAKPNNAFLTDIERMEKNRNIREENTFISDETYKIHDFIEEINKEYKNKIQVKYFSSEYRLPMIIAKKYEEDEITTSGWLTVTLPPYKSKKHFILRGRYKDDEEILESNEELNFIYMMDIHFDSIWNVAKEWNEIK